MPTKEIFENLSEYDLSEINNPAFAQSDIHQLCDWRNYIHHDIKYSWHELPFKERAMLYFNAAHVAALKTECCRYKSEPNGFCRVCNRHFANLIRIEKED